MQIKVLYFAQLRDLFGISETTLRMDDGISVGQALDEIIKGHEDAVDWASVRFAVNEEFSHKSLILRDQDTLVLLPPVSGG